ncbi:DUF3696 domain-containing protein [Caballeronia sp. GAFFF3]|uniref:AAA family ATPase n=1 Tax=Caballeronia sp. GAFFF3 TaxID=2921759 RepID=UPI0020293485|nr:DUF3696 domain-containing protein [Caballeronia sp. GAFFF3]
MLTKLYLENFKSIGKRTSVDLSPLTVFAGSNSSGKSTLLQSVLLLAQTIQSNVYRRSIVLNGAIIRLGTFRDIFSANVALNSASDSKNITIGFDMQPKQEELHYNQNRRNVLFSEEQLVRTQCIHFEMRFSGGAAASGAAQLQPELERITLSYMPRERLDIDTDDQLVLRRRPIEVDELFKRERIEQGTISQPERASFAFEVEKPFSYTPRWTPVQTPITLGVHLQHFLPRAMAFTYDALNARCNTVYQALTTAGGHYLVYDAGDFLYSNPEACGLILGVLTEHAERMSNRESASNFMKQRVQKSISQLKSNFSARQISNFYTEIPASYRQSFIAAFSEPSFKSKLFEALKRGQKEERRIGGGPLPENLDFSGNYVHSFFSERIRYLGPLRDEPKPIYPYGGSIDSQDVGTKGESTAAVLDLHKETEIYYIPSESVKAAPGSAVPVKATLLAAVSDWLDYMGVAQRVETRDQGKLGHELRVSTNNSPGFHDLTHVGVGVSQVLPILVQALLVEPGACLIFEQPELHLHPKVQTRLADFFVSVAVLGKQCIIETHSEYLINELRYLAVLAQDKEVSKLTTVYFVEKHAEGSVYEPLRFNEYGTISNWPQGFFDESEELAAETIRAAMNKRKRKNNSN